MLAFQIFNETPKDFGLTRQLVDQYLTVLVEDSVSYYLIILNLHFYLPLISLKKVPNFVDDMNYHILN